MKRKELKVGAAVILVLIVVAAGLVWRNYQEVKAGFPMWERAEEIREKEDLLQITLWNIRQPCGEGLAWDELRLSADTELGFYEPVLVDHAWAGKWYTVYEGTFYYKFENKWAKLKFPAGLFSRDGLYRVRMTRRKPVTGELQQVGSYQFRAKHLSGPPEGTENNDFDRWVKCGEEDDPVNENVTLTAKRTYTDEDGRAMLEFGLVSDMGSFSCGEEKRIDRLWQGDWYMVSPPYMGPNLGAWSRIAAPGEEYTETVEIPPQVLEHPGTYRLYWDDVAYCEFTVG